MHKVMAIALALWSMSVLTPGASADIVHAPGVGQVHFTARKPDAVEQQTALKQAKDKAIARALKQQGRPDAAKIYRGCLLDEAGYADVIVNYSAAAPKINSQLKQLQQRIKASVDMQALDDHINACSPPDLNRVGFVVVARKQAETEGYAAYRGNIENGLKSVFARGGYEVASGLEMELRSGGIYNKNLLVSAYTESGRVNWDAPRIAGLVSDVDLLLVGTVEVGASEKSRFNGKTIVNVSASLDLADLQQRLSVASVHNVKLSAEADTEQEATAEAARLVAAAAGRLLLDKLALAGQHAGSQADNQAD